MRIKLWTAFALGGALGVAAGCQTYDFEPVKPLAIAQTTQAKDIVARKLKPNVMILLDKSGSMGEPINPSDPSCGGCGAPPKTPCGAGCKTRVSEMRDAMSTFLGSAPVGRYGLTVYPKGVVCDKADTIAIDIPNVGDDDDTGLRAAASKVKDFILNNPAASPGGGTPTAQSLEFVSSYAGLQSSDRDNFVLLLTDGLPNCNENNTKNCNNNQCQCTTGNGQCTGDFCARGCLDDLGVASAGQGLQAKNIKTIVVGFGADIKGDPRAFNTLNLAAEAGGFPRSCPDGTNAECGGSSDPADTCDTARHLCTKRYYSATNGQELTAALQKIGQVIGGLDACRFTLDSVPSRPEFLAVLVDGKATASGSATWELQGNRVTFFGDICNRLQASTPSNKVSITFRIVETL